MGSLLDERRSKYSNADVIVSLRTKHGFDQNSNAHDRKSMMGAPPLTMLLRVMEAIDKKSNSRGRSRRTGRTGRLCKNEVEEDIMKGAGVDLLRWVGQYSDLVCAL